MNNKIETIVRRAANNMNAKEYDVDAGWKRLKNANGIGEKHLNLSRWVGYAACVAIVISATVYGLIPRELYTDISVVVVQKELNHEPILASPELVLSNGRTIKLESLEHDINVEELGVQIFQDSVGQVSYQNYGVPRQELQYNELKVPKGADFELKLADGSVVTLNSESTLRFPVHFMPDSRVVYLEGEAFFDVVKNPDAPFKVITGDKQVTVLGTQFNVSAYADDRSWETTLVSGKVAVETLGRMQVLHPSEQLAIDNRTGKSIVKVVDTELYISWKDGIFQFKGYRFEDIVRKMERWYDFTMIYQDESIKDMKFRGFVDKHNPLQETLEYIESTTGITFIIHGNEITVKRNEK